MRKTKQLATDGPVPVERIDQELRVRLSQQEAVAELGLIALKSLDLDGLLHKAITLISKNLVADYCKVLELLPDGEQFLLKAGTGWKPGYVGTAKVSAGLESQAGFTLKQNEPVIVTNLQEERRFSGPPLLFEHGVISGISVVIPGPERPYGVIGAHTRSQHEFSRHDANFLQSVANLLSSAITHLQGEAALRSSRDQLAVILESVAEGLTVQDARGRLLYANEIAAQLMGVSTAEEALSTPLAELVKNFELFDEQGNPFPVERLPGRRALQGEKTPDALVGFRSISTGEERWSLVRASPVFDPHGKVQFAVNIFQDITELKRVEQGQRFLAQAADLLTSSLDYQKTLKNVAQMAVTHFADWCSIHIVEHEGEEQAIRQLVVAHQDPEKVDFVLELQQKYPPDPNPDRGLQKVLRTGEVELFPEFTDSQFEAAAKDQEHLELLRELELKSAIILPLIAQERILGALTLVWSGPGGFYTENDLYLGKELARRASQAINTARLYEEINDLNAELESRVTKRTAQLERAIQKLRAEISERKRTERELIKSEALLTDLFESSPDSTLLVRPEGKLVRVNAQTETLFGYDRAELIGKPVELLMPDRFRQGHTRYRNKYGLDPQQRAMGAGLDLFGRRKDGSEFPVDIMLSPVEIDSKTMVLCVVRDITLRKRLQAELVEVHHRLMDGLEAERLLLSQELHDGSIQELFSVMYQLNDLVKATSLSEMAEKTDSAYKAIQKVIQDLRAICGELRPPTLSPFGLEAAIRGHLENFQKRHPEIMVHSELMPDAQRLKDSERLALFRIYQQAMSNIIRHAKAKQVWVKLILDTEHIALEIRDDGIGFQMPPKWLDLAREGHLGLIGTRERVDAIGGWLKIESSPGQGTIVNVSIPVAEQITSPKSQP